MQTESIAAFQRSGWTVARGLIARGAVESVRKCLESQAERAQAQMRALGIRVGTEHVAADIHALLSGPDARTIDRNLRMTMTGHYPLDVRLDPELWAIPRDAGLRGLLRALLDASALRMHMPPTARFVLPGNTDAGVPAHQDLSYNTHMSRFVTVWVPLVEVDHECGGVTMFEGSDAEFTETAMNHHGIWMEEIDVSAFSSVDCVPMSPGDALIFNPLVAHRSMPNVSDRTRFSIDYRFFGRQDASTKHYLDMNQWEVIAPDEQ